MRRSPPVHVLINTQTILRMPAVSVYVTLYSVDGISAGASRISEMVDLTLELHSPSKALPKAFTSPSSYIASLEPGAFIKHVSLHREEYYINLTKRAMGEKCSVHLFGVHTKNNVAIVHFKYLYGGHL